MATVELERGENEIVVRGQGVAFATLDDGTGERVIYIENDALNLNLRTIHDSLYAAPDGTETVRFIVIDGATVGSTSTATKAMVTGSWPSGVALFLDNLGRIEGKGGNAGAGGSNSNGTAGQPGGDALQATFAISIDNTGGEIWAGAGGGGGGGGDTTLTFYAGGGGGGGGAGAQGGSGASGGAGNSGPSSQGASGAAGTEPAGGAGGAGGNISGGALLGGNGGAGGGPGVNGTSGSTGHGSFGGFITHYLGGTGGAAGDYIVGNSFVTWVANGDRRGGVS
jgi:hypothetical protein